MILEAKELSKEFYQNAQKIKVLDKLNLSMGKKESLAIVGPSGSGKSTLLALLSGLEVPSSGSVLYKNANIQSFTADQKAKWRREEISIVFQQFHLFPHLTALENTMLPLELLDKKNASKEAKEMLERVGLSHRLHHFPTTLSGGESQRVAIARSLVHRPQLVFADEPSGNLDINTGNKVMELFFQLIEETEASVVLVTHNIELAQRCQKQLSLK